MKPRERVLKAMNMEQPDRVPVMCQFSIGFMNQQLKETKITPMELWNDAEKYADALIYLRERFNFDGILVVCTGISPIGEKKPKWKLSTDLKLPHLKIELKLMLMMICRWENILKRHNLTLTLLM